MDRGREVEELEVRGLLSCPAVTVNGNWRMTFEFRDGNAYVLDYEDYH